MTLRLFVSTFALGLVVGACNNDEPTLDSGLDGAKLGSDLTPDEQSKLCEATAAYNAEVFPASEATAASCTLTAIFATLALTDSSDPVKSCTTLRDACIADPPASEPKMCDLGVDWATCMATVAEIEACYEEFGQATADALRSLSCAKIEEYQTSPPDMQMDLDTACSSAKAKCPTVVGSSGPDMP